MHRTNAIRFGSPSRRFSTAALIALALVWGIACTPPQSDRSASSDSLFRQLDTARLHVLTDTQLARIRVLQQTFSDVDTMSFATWVYNFERDLDPEGEMRIWESMGDAYRGYAAGRSLTPAAKLDVYQILLLRSGAPDSVVLARMELKELSINDAKAVLKRYLEKPDPIKFYRKPPG